MPVDKSVVAITQVIGSGLISPMIPVARLRPACAGEQKHGAAIHQCIRQVIKALDAGAFYYSDWHVDDQHHEEHGQAKPRRRGAGSLADKQQETRDCVNDCRQVRPNGVSIDPLGSHHFQRNAGNVIGVYELFEAVIQHGNGNEVARNRRQDVRATIAPLLRRKP